MGWTGTGMGRPQVTRRKPRPVGRVWRVFKWCGRGVGIAVVELQLAALPSVALGAAAMVATLSSLVLAAAVAAVVAGVVLVGTWRWQLQLQPLCRVVLIGVGSCSCSCCCHVILVGRGSCSCSRCCRQRDDECPDVAVGRYVTGTHGSCSREPIPVATGTGLVRVWVRVQLELPVGYPCYALRITPLLMFRVIEEVVVGRDNADGKNNSSTCVSSKKGGCGRQRQCRWPQPGNSRAYNLSTEMRRETKKRLVIEM